MYKIYYQNGWNIHEGLYSGYIFMFDFFKVWHVMVEQYLVAIRLYWEYYIIQILIGNTLLCFYFWHVRFIQYSACCS